MPAGESHRIELLTAITAEAIAPLGLLVDDLRITPAGKRRVVRIAVDDDLSGVAAGDTRTPVEPLSLDDVAEATRRISDALDTSDVFGDAPYVLEVSSPGVSRPLQEWRHFRRNVGRLVEITRRDETRLTGRLVAAGTDELILRAGPDDPSSEEQGLAYADIARARVQVEFARESDQED